ncbi:DNA cytosine methyltransferase [Ascidiaceihabitans sp.]|uniref:DNA cytosine methyltransferase n=1 Tax=Ascidiaceihabitans sp. TaxID=1872644 RepID=UPI003296A226
MAIHPPERHDELRGISLCAGVAGLDLGLHIAEPGYRTVCYVERNSFAAATLVARMADASLGPAPIWDDLKSFDGHPWRGKVHILTAGYPCQPFTLSGLRKGENDPRHLWPDVARITEETQPEWLFFENVAGHLTLGLQDVTRDLQAMGYRVATRVVSAAEVGGSHTRERLFILAHTNVQGIGQQSLHCGHGERDAIQKRSEPDWNANRDQECRQRLDTDVGSDDSRRLDTPAFPIFPPVPSNFVEWGKALERSPELKPCIHGLDDGLAFGLDRSGAAGNGVVSLAAAHAYCALRAELEG